MNPLHLACEKNEMPKKVIMKISVPSSLFGLHTWSRTVSRTLLSFHTVQNISSLLSVASMFALLYFIHWDNPIKAHLICEFFNFSALITHDT